jgi:hypothetical protein
MSRPVSPNSTIASPSARNGNVSPSRRLSPSRPKSGTKSVSPNKRAIFSESDFEKKRESVDPEQRKKQLQAKIRGLKLEPKDWTKQELFEKMANYFQIVYENSQSSLGAPSSSSASSPNKVGIVSEINIINGVKLTNDEIIIFNEFCRRNTELRNINLSNAGINDDYLKLILQGCKNVKFIKCLCLNHNLLTMAGLEEIAGAYGGITQDKRKRLEKVTLQGNTQLSYDNGYSFVQSMLSIDQINTIPISELKKEANKIHSWNLASQDIRLFELGIICFLLKTYLAKVEELSLSSNQITPKAMHHLLDCIIRSVPTCHTLNLSYNNVTNNGYDMSAVKKLITFLQSSKQFQYVYLDGVSEISKETIESINRSCSVNRSLDRNQNNFYFFNDYMKELIAAKGKTRETSFQNRKDLLLGWQPSFNEIDEDFIRRNRLPVCDIKFMYHEDQSDDEEEAVISSKKSSKKKEEQKKKVAVDEDSGSLISKVSYDDPTEPNTSDNIINGFKLRWIMPKAEFG